MPNETNQILRGAAIGIGTIGLIAILGLSIVTLVKVSGNNNNNNNGNYVPTNDGNNNNNDDGTPVVNNISSNNTYENTNQSFPISFIFNFNYNYSQNNYLINDTFNINYADIDISNNTANSLVYSKIVNDTVIPGEKFEFLKKMFNLQF